MSKYLGHLLALFVGITLTVGVYEGSRLYRNTAKAWAAAQSQVTGKDTTNNARRQALIKALEEEKGAEHVAQLKKQRTQKGAQKPETKQKLRQLTPGQSRAVRGVGQGAARKQASKDLTPAQRDVIRQKRKRRRDRLKAEHGSAKPKERRAGAKGAPGEDAVEPAEGVAEDVVEDVVEDTAL